MYKIRNSALSRWLLCQLAQYHRHHTHTHTIRTPTTCAHIEYVCWTTPSSRYALRCVYIKGATPHCRPNDRVYRYVYRKIYAAPDRAAHPPTSPYHSSLRALNFLSFLHFLVFRAASAILVTSNHDIFFLHFADAPLWGLMQTTHRPCLPPSHPHQPYTYRFLLKQIDGILQHGTMCVCVVVAVRWCTNVYTYIYTTGAASCETHTCISRAEMRIRGDFLYSVIRVRDDVHRNGMEIEYSRSLWIYFQFKLYNFFA